MLPTTGTGGRLNTPSRTKDGHEATEFRKKPFEGPSAAPRGSIAPEQPIPTDKEKRS